MFRKNKKVKENIDTFLNRITSSLFSYMTLPNFSLHTYEYFLLTV